MSGKIHFKLTHDGVTRRFALSHAEKDLVAVLKDRVIKVTGVADISLFWKDDDSNIVLESAEDLETAIDFAQSKNKLGCVYLDFEETKMVEKEREAKRDTKIVVTAEDSAVSFNGRVFQCDGCDCYLSRSNGGRFMCTICSNFDLCAECLGKDEHPNHAFVRLLNGETIIPSKEMQGMNAGIAPNCTPKFVVDMNEFRKISLKKKTEDKMNKPETIQKKNKEVKREETLNYSRDELFNIKNMTDNGNSINGISLNLRAAASIPIEVRRQQMQEKVDKMQQLKAKREDRMNAVINKILASSGQSMRFPQDEKAIKDCAIQSERAWNDLMKVAQKKVEEIKKEQEQKLEYSRNEMMNIRRESDRDASTTSAFVSSLPSSTPLTNKVERAYKLQKPKQKDSNDEQRTALLNKILASSGQSMRFPMEEEALRDSIVQSQLAWNNMKKEAQQKMGMKVNEEDEKKMEYLRNEKDLDRLALGLGWTDEEEMNEKRGVNTMGTQSARPDTRYQRMNRSYDFTFGRPSNQRVDRDYAYEEYVADPNKNKTFDEMQKKTAKYANEDYSVKEIHRCNCMWGTCNDCLKIEDEEFRKMARKNHYKSAFEKAGRRPVTEGRETVHTSVLTPYSTGFASTPFSSHLMKNEEGTNSVDRPTNEKNVNKNVLNELRATGLFVDDAKMIAICREATTLEQAIDMMLQ